MGEKKIYRAKRGAQFPSSRAQVYGEAIDNIREKKGGQFTPADIIESGKDPHSPLHEYFEWDNEIAGEKYRKHQARHLVNHIVTVYIKSEGEEIEQNAFVNVTINDKEKMQSCYVTLKEALTDKKLRQQVLEKAIREAEYWQTKYTDYNELKLIFNAIEMTKIDIVKTINDKR